MVHLGSTSSLRADAPEFMSPALWSMPPVPAPIPVWPTMPVPQVLLGGDGVGGDSPT